MTIRKFQRRGFTAEDPVRADMLTERALDSLRRAIDARHNILISGGTSTGKTTLLNALAAFLPDAERDVQSVAVRACRDPARSLSEGDRRDVRQRGGVDDREIT